jgi:hypothetical protein
VSRIPESKLHRYANLELPPLTFDDDSYHEQRELFLEYIIRDLAREVLQLQEDIENERYKLHE